MWQRRYLYIYSASLFVVMLFSQANAHEVTARLSNGVEVSADFIAGKPDKPALLILHGFLQTRTNATVDTLKENLAGDGYAVLAPTLSLGVARRKQSLPCETPHTHTFEEDVMEVAFWVNWLHQETGRDIVLIGHSTGNTQLLAYSSQQLHTAVRKLIAVSVVEYEREFGGKQNVEQIKQAKQKVKNRDHSLSGYRLSYCNQYIAPASAFLSYAQWNGDRIIQTIKTLKLPVDVIAGDADSRMRDGWLQSLQKTNAKIKLVNGANHFFSDRHEFDLHDRVREAISR